MWAGFPACLTFNYDEICLSEKKFTTAPAEEIKGSYSDSLYSPPLDALSPPACSFPHPFASLSLHCCYRFSAILALFLLLALAESGSRRCAASLRSSTQSTSTFVFISEFLSLLFTLTALLPCLFPPLSSFSSPLITSLQSFRTTASCSKLAPAVRWPCLFAAGPRRTKRSV